MIYAQGTNLFSTQPLRPLSPLAPATRPGCSAPPHGGSGELTAKGYLFTPDEFNRFCLDRNLQPRLVKRHLYAAGYIEGTQEANGKMNYSCFML